MSMTPKQMVERFWDSAYGEPKDYGVDLETDELDGYQIGDDFIVVQDYETEMSGAYEGDTGQILAITLPKDGGGAFGNPPEPAMLLVSVEGNDPMKIPTHVIS